LRAFFLRDFFAITGPLRSRVVHRPSIVSGQRGTQTGEVEPPVAKIP